MSKEYDIPEDIELEIPVPEPIAEVRKCSVDC